MKSDSQEHSSHETPAPGVPPPEDSEADPILRVLFGVAALLAFMAVTILGRTPAVPELDPVPAMVESKGSKPKSLPRPEDRGTSSGRYKKRPQKFFTMITVPSFSKVETDDDWHRIREELESSEYVDDLWKLSYFYKDRRNPYRDEEMFREYRKMAAEEGYYVAQWELGQDYEKGSNGREVDLDQAEHYYDLAAHQGLGNAKTSLKKLRAKRDS